MYSVLIVDDEKMIRDDVYGLLSMEESMEMCIRDSLRNTAAEWS